MNRHLISAGSTVLSALEMLNDLSGQVMTLFVIDSDGRMTGTLTDGDIRRGLLAGALLSDPVDKVMLRSFRSLSADGIDLRRLKQLRQQGIRLIPVLDTDGRPVDIIDTSVTPTRLPVSAILMAGGKGERLRPLTLDTPKPLLAIGGKAIIDYNIDAIRRAGITRTRVAVNYLAEKIEAHFAGTGIECVRETSPLGTLGAASLMDHQPGGDTLVMNADLLTSLSLEDMYLTHRDSANDITIAAIPYNVAVPYAILTTDSDGRVTELQEKPSYSYYANAGIYLISNRLLSGMPRGERMDATDLIEQVIAAGGRVGYFPVSGIWIDIGSPVDFAHARELMRQHRLLADA
ncbi:MAG: NTP transferase domain-containing protein [Bacteroides sp.]|nr:NTP transferase domain-containing protein [Bacteroides sp.]